MTIQFFNDDGSRAGSDVVIGPRVSAAIVASGATDVRQYLVAAVGEVVRQTVNQYAPEVITAREAKQASDAAAAEAYERALAESEQAVSSAIAALLTPGA